MTAAIFGLTFLVLLLAFAWLVVRHVNRTAEKINAQLLKQAAERAAQEGE